MNEPESVPNTQAVERLEESTKDLREKVELIHHQIGYLQMQISALSGAHPTPPAKRSEFFSTWRSVMIRVAKRNTLLYKVAIRVGRFLRR